MNGNNVYIPHSQTEHTTITDSVFFDNAISQETIQPTMVSMISIFLKMYNYYF